MRVFYKFLGKERNFEEFMKIVQAPFDEDFRMTFTLKETKREGQMSLESIFKECQEVKNNEIKRENI